MYLKKKWFILIFSASLQKIKTKVTQHEKMYFQLMDIFSHLINLSYLSLTFFINIFWGGSHTVKFF